MMGYLLVGFLMGIALGSVFGYICGICSERERADKRGISNASGGKR